jgi:DNA recombination protein RmuC
MEIIIIITGAVIVALLLILLLRRNRPADTAPLLMLQQQLEALKTATGQDAQAAGKLMTESVIKMQESLGLHLKTVTDGINTRLRESRESMDSTNKRLDDSAKYMLNLEKRLAELGEKTQALSNIGKDINRISDIFQSPKLRGNLGELILENLLEQIMPKGSFELQYLFPSDRSQVDAVLRIGDRLVPVDSKFPLENFRKLYAPDVTDEQKIRLRKDFASDLKKHIDAIADKYIKPAEGTFDFALMYIPSETIYYEIITRDEKLADGNSIIDHAKKKKVVPVSPNSFYAYLQVIVFGLKGMEIEKDAREIQERLKRVQVDFQKFFDHFTKIGSKIDAVRKEYDGAARRFELLDKQVGRITGQESLLPDERAPQAPDPPQ